MREAVFIKRNIDKWREYESLMGNLPSQTADYLLFLYNDITADLSFAQSHYPNSRITTFLNGMAVQVHNEVYKAKPQSASRLVSFWVHEVPYAVWCHRRELFISLAVFLVSIASGVMVRRIIVRMAVLFGLFQALMPLMGWMATSRFSGYLEAVDHWVAFGLLAAALIPGYLLAIL